MRVSFIRNLDLYFVSDIESLPVIHRQTNQLNTDNLEKKQRQYKYAFNLAEIDSESFPMHILENMRKTFLKTISYHYYNEASVKGNIF